MIGNEIKKRGKQPEDFRNNEKGYLEKMSRQKLYHLKAASEIDRQLIAVQKSTRVNIPQLSRLHNYLRAKFPWYYRWHLNKYANLIHILILSLYISCISVASAFSSLTGWKLSELLKPLQFAHAASIDISGSCKQYDQSTNCTNSETVKVAVNGSIAAQTGTTSSGSWTISAVTASDNDVLTVFIDGVADANEAVAVIKLGTAGNVTGVLLYERHVTLGASPNQTVSNTNISQYDNSVSSDEDIFMEVDSSGNLLIPATSTQTATDQELYIVASNTYRPNSSGGKSATAPNLEIPSNATITADSNTIELTASGTPYVVSGTFNYDTSTFKYSSGSNTTITAANYYKLELKPSSGGATSDYTVASAGDTSYNGGYSNAGTVNGYSYYTYNGSGTRYLFYATTPMGQATWRLNTSTMANLTAPSSAAYYIFSSTPTGSYSAGLGTTPAPTVSASGASAASYTLASGTFNVYNNFTAGDGTHGVTVDADTNDPTFNVDGDFSISANGGTFTASASGSLTIAGNYSNSGTFTDSGGTVTFDKSSGTQTITSGGTGSTQDFQNVTKSSGGAGQLATNAIKINGTLTIDSSNTFDINGQNLTLATLSNSGTLKLQGGETASITSMDSDSGAVEYTGTSTYTSLAAGSSYYDLTINGSGGSFSPAATVTVNNDLTISAGTLAGTQSINVNGGDATGNGTINLTGGTFRLDSSGNFGGTTDWTFSNLTFGDGSGTATSTKTSSNQITTTSVLTIASNQTLDAGDDTWVLSGADTPFVKTGTLTYSTSTFKYVAADDLTVAVADYYNLETSPNAAASGGWTVSGAGTTAYNGTYTQDGTNNGKPAYTDGTHWIFNDYAESPAANYWCMYTSKINVSMPGMQCPYYSSSVDLPGTWYTGTGGTAPVPTLSENAGTANYTFASGTINILGNYTNGDGTNAASITATTNDPNIDISGNFTNSASATFIASNSGTFNIAGNITINSTAAFTHSSGTVTLDGGGSQTITANGTDTAHTLNNLTLTNASTSGVTFADSLTLAGTFTATTASSKATFHSGSTYAFNAISINGQAVGTRVTLTSSTGGSAWNLNITASSPTASYVSVKDSNANKDIDATTGGEDLTGNTHWLFPSGISVSGTCKLYDESTSCADGTVLKIATNNSLQAQTATVSSGTFTISGVAQPVADDKLTVFADNVADEFEAVTVIKYVGSGNVSDVLVLARHLTLVSSSGETVYNPGIALYDYSASGDEDIFFDVDANYTLEMPYVSATSYSDQILYITSGTIHSPELNGDAISTVPNLKVASGGTLYLDSNTIVLTASGTPFTLSGTFTYGTGTFKYSANSSTTITASTYYNLITAPTGSSPTYTLASGTINVEGNYTNGDGTNAVTTTADTNDPIFNVNGTFTNSADATFVASNSASFSVASNFTNDADAVFTHSSGTLTLDGQGAQGISSGGDAFNNLTISNTSAEVQESDAATISDTLTINASAIYDTNGQDLTLTTLSNSGTLRMTNGESSVTITTKDTDSGTVEYDGSGTYTTFKYGATYWSLKISGSGSFTQDAALTVYAALSLTNGTLDTNSSSNHAQTIGTSTTTNGSYSQTGGTFNANASAITCYGNYSVTSGTYTAGTSTLTLDATPGDITWTGAGYTFYNVIPKNTNTSYARYITPGSGNFTMGGTMTATGNSSQKAYLRASTNNPNFDISGSLSGSNGGYYFGSGTWNISGDILLVNQTCDFGTSTVVVKGTGKLVEMNNGSFYDIRFDGSSTFRRGYYSHLFEIPTGVTVTQGNASYGVQAASGAQTNILGTLSGSGQPIRFDGTSSEYISTGGTFDTSARFFENNGKVTARVYKKDVTFYENHGGGTWILGTDVGQTFRVEGSMYLTNNTGSPDYVSTSTYNTTVEIVGNLETNGTGAGIKRFVAGNSAWSVGGNITLTAGTLDAGASTFTLNGTALQTITANSQSFYNLTVTNASTAGVTFADSATVTSTFTDVTASSVLTFDALSTYAFANININGQATGTKITMQSNDPSNADLPSRQWYFNVSQSSPQASYVTVTDSDANGGNAITPVNCIDGGNTENWLFSFSVSGTIYTDESKSTNIGADKTVAVSVNGGTKTTVETTSGGVFSFTGVAAATNYSVSLYLSGETEKASLITLAANGTTDITGLELYTSHIVLTHHSSGPMTNTLLATADNVSDSDLLLSVDGSNNATFTTGNEVWILGSKTYTSGGNVTCGSLDILSTATFAPEANILTLTDSGTPLIVTGTFTEGTSTVTYTGSSATNVTGTTYYNLTVNQTGTTFTSAANSTVKGVFTITAGTFDASDDTLTLSGAGTPFVNNDTFTASSSTVKYEELGANVAAVTYNNLSFDKSNIYDGYKKVITISNSTGSTLSNYQVKVSLSSSNFDFSHSTSTGQDLRFKSIDNLTDLNYYIESWDQTGQTATIWVKVPSITTSGISINMYYGDGTLSAESSGSDVFDLFDDFDSLSAWTTSGSSVSASGGIAILDSGSSPTMYRNFSISQPFTTEIKYQRPSDYRNRLYLTTQALTYSPTGFDYGDFGTSLYWNAWTGVSLSNDTWYTIRWDATTSDYIWKVFDSSGTELLSRSYGAAISNLGRIHISGTESTSSDLKMDWVRIRQYASTEPGVTFSAEYDLVCGWTISGDTVVNNDLTITNGDVAGSSYNLTVKGDWNNTGTFTKDTSTVILAGTDAQSVTAGGSSFYNLTVTNASTAGVTFADSATVTGTFTDVTASSVLTFDALSTYAFANININGQATGTKITMQSNDPSNADLPSRQWYFNVSQSSPVVAYASVINSDANGGNGISAASCTDGGNNENWSFGILISGTIYTTENKSSNIGASKTVAISINGGTATTVETGSGGTFSFGKLVSANQTVAVYLSAETEKASLVTQAVDASTDITGLELYTSHIVLTHQTTGPMTNTLLATADNVSDSDLLVSVSGSDATFTTGNEVWILGSKTYTPGGNVTCGSLEVLSTAAFSPEANTVTFTDSGTPFTITGTFNESTSTIIYTGSTATNVTGTTYNNLTLNYTGTTFTAVGDITAKSILTIQAGTFDASNKNIILSGSGTPFVKTGTFSYSTSTVKYQGSSATTITAADYYILESSPASGSPTHTIASGTVNVNNNLNIGDASNAVTVNADTNDPTLNVDGTMEIKASANFTASNSGSFSVASNFINSVTSVFTHSSGTLTLDGQGLQTITAGGTDGDHDFYNLTVTNASTAGVSFADSLTVSGTFTDTTASSKLTFLAGATYTIAAIDLNGQATGTRITMVSSTEGSHYHFNVSAASPSASYVNVRDSDASGGNQINATVGCYDSTGNTNWLFYYECIWTGASSNDWNTAGNWSACGSSIPGTDGNATINLSTANSTVTTSANISFHNLTIGGDTTYTNKLTLTNNITSGNNLTITSNGTLEQKNAVTQTISGDLTINGTSGYLATLTHTTNDTTANGERYKVMFSVGGNATVDTYGTINADYLGYSALYGPGTGTGNRGGAYGGEGSGNLYVNNNTYGSITSPTNLGSGGSYYRGGGAILLSVTGTATINGTISANGEAVSGQWGAGSGGTTSLSAASISGTGFIRANGGTGGTYHGAGGGRVAVKLSSGTDFGSVNIQAYGGAADFNSGAAGTVYLQKSTDTDNQGELVVDNNNLALSPRSADHGVTLQNGSSSSSYKFARISLKNAGIYAIDSNDALDISEATISGDQDNTREGIYLLDGAQLTGLPNALSWTDYFIGIRGSSTVFNPTTSITVGDKATLIVDAPFTFNCSITVLSGGSISHWYNYTSEQYKLDITLSGSNNLDIQSGGSIDASSKGYYLSAGPGVGITNWGAAHGGGSGQLSGGANNNTYGSAIAPVNLGTGGMNSRGGGAVKFVVPGAITLNGNIYVNGEDYSGYSSGAGGSVYLTSSTISGSGTIKANGGLGTTYYGGGGGRIAVVLTSGTGFDNITMQAYGGPSSNSLMGAAGTIYRKTASQTNGTITIDNNGTNSSSAHASLYGESTNCDATCQSKTATFDGLTLSNYGKLALFETQNITVGAALSIPANSQLNFSHSTTDPGPTLNVSGDLTNAGTINYLGTGPVAYIVHVTGNVNTTSGTYTASSSTLYLDGSAAQTLTSGSQSFNNLTVTNASANGVTFADSATVTGTFTDVTASSKLTFHALSTYAFANININGQASGTKITMVSSDPTNVDLPSRQWYFNVSQTSPTATYVNVTDSDANGGNTITPVTSTDGGNNENWLFNLTPTNDSLTFTNPYSGTDKTAVADDTTEWNFEAKVSDPDGSTDINYLELKLANNSDSTAPYDSLKFRWTEATDTFSEEADTQSAATITSTSSDSNASGNQWTINFKIKFNANFDAMATDYAAELYTLDDGSASDNDNYSTLYRVEYLSLTIQVDNSTLDFSSLLPGSVVTDTTITTVTCNHPNGYTLSVSDSVSGAFSALLHTDLLTRIADYADSIASPSSWTGTGLGITVYQATQKEGKWGTGTTESDSNNKYAAIPEAATIIHTKTGSPTSSDQTYIGYKIVVPNTQKTGAYSGTVTYTATGVLN